MKRITKDNGITLIALVITIIVLLILAGVTIATLFGDNGILSKATQAKDEQADATVKEAISIAWNEYQIMLNEPTGEVKKSETKLASTEKIKIQGEETNFLATPTMSFLDFLREEKGYIDENGVVNVKALTGETLSRGNGTDGETDVYKVEEGTDTYTLKYYGEENEEKILWEVSKTTGGATGEIDWDKIFAEAEPPEEQSDSNTAIGVGPSGETVNMDNWLSEKNNEEDEYRLNGDNVCGSITSAYTGEINENGEIEGEIPQYINKEGDDQFLPVTVLYYTFAGCDDLKIAPKLPATVKYMQSTFYGCTSLTTVPEIPSGVTDMTSTFQACTSLTTAPEIPSGVTDMRFTFSGCTSLEIAPEIPDSVTNMMYTFSQCTNLKSVSKLSKNLNDMQKAFENCINLTTVKEIPVYGNINNAFNGCKNLKGEIIITGTGGYSNNCFYNAATSGETLTLVGSNEEILKELQATGSENSKIEYRVEAEQ